MAEQFDLLYLENNPYYTYNTTLGRVAYNITMRFSNREKCWYMDIRTRDNVPVILSVKLVPNYPMLEGYQLGELTGYLLLFSVVPSNLYKIETEPENIADYFQLVYVYES